MASSSSWPFSRARTISTLTTVQHGSAIAFGSFLIVHLAAPAVAVVAPSGEAVELATKTMILGRVFYQNAVTELTIVWGALGLHLASSFAKRVMLALPLHKRRPSSSKGDETIQGYSIPEHGPTDASAHPPPPQKRRRKPLSFPSIHTLTGFILAPAVALHAALNRLVPSRSSAPISDLSPSELDYSYVVHGFQHDSNASWRAITYGLYAALLAAGALHVAGGSDKIAKRLQSRRGRRVGNSGNSHSSGSSSTIEVGDSKSSPRAAAKSIDVARKAQRKKTATGAVALLGAGWLGWGIRRMNRESEGLISSWSAKRFDACYAAIWPYSATR
ncbi:hypothetical protein FA10DRAFT_265573 [Acaromyces ingoldii]|uniref:Mitochondrial adapter protein MCP1 transmembrane domain-containing protein n=1 Tax=Acaromyces ingoldii TaxID=215250 RepID=A0A316YQR8_9BASI|nr:hypothetical protein FA10DRAFT_265573 [Acaromyces ingoldii]PWN91727.1 hypothetical protein FA10DRAFT_265573 [Acaromyces ingoldii]